MTPIEKFRLFLGVYLATLCTQSGTRVTALLSGRGVPGEWLIEGQEEEQAYQFAAWYSGRGARPIWLPNIVGNPSAYY